MIAFERPVGVLVAGLGTMGRSHAYAYHNNSGFEIVGLVNRSPVELPGELNAYPLFQRCDSALAALKPNFVSINTYPESHADYAVAAMEAGAHVFVEKPLDAKRTGAARHMDDAVQSFDCLPGGG
jgi:predicted dehydrogenase